MELNRWISKFIRTQYCFYSNGATHWSIHGHVIQVIWRSCRAERPGQKHGVYAESLPKHLFMPSVHAEFKGSNFENWNCVYLDFANLELNSTEHLTKETVLDKIRIMGQKLVWCKPGRLTTLVAHSKNGVSWICYMLWSSNYQGISRNYYSF